ncbi:MAG: TonB-dependent receptor [Hyphomicrobiaceae bacterium]
MPGRVVEGEKVLRTLRDTTTSVGIITGQDIADRNIRDLDGAIGQAANVVTSTNPDSGFSVRGLNSEGQTGNQNISAVPLVGVVIDGVTQNPDAVRRGARGLWDIDQVEVLRGPQSTLQGRNSLAGTVIVKTNDPTYKREAIVEGTIGTNDLWGTGFVLNSPIVAGQSAFRISGYKTDRTRDIDYADPKNAEMGMDYYDTLRAKFLFEPDSLPGFSALFTASRTHDRPGTSIVTGPDFFARNFADTAALTDFRRARADNFASDLAYEFMPGVKLRSVTAYAKTSTQIKTAEGAAFARDGDHTDGKDFTQDLRLEIENSGNGLSGVVGLFYGRFNRDSNVNQSVDLGFYQPLFFPPGTYISYNQGTVAGETTSIAAYADLRYRINRWALIAGGRLLRDTVKTREDTIPLDPNTFTYSVNRFQTEATFNEFLPKVGITYDLTRNQTVGLTYNKGYRTGFEQFVVGTGRSTVAPEYLDAYEFSYRSNWLNKTLELNANTFYYDYTNQQIAVLDPFFNAIIVNAGRSHAYGAEIEGRWRPIPELQMYANLGLMRTEFDEIVFEGVDRSGNEYPQAPAYTLGVGAKYQSTMGWFVAGNVRHIAGYYSFGDIANIAAKAVDGYTVVDASVGWQWKNYTLTLFSKNLLDEKYLTAVDRTTPPGTGFVGDGRVVGLTLRGQF